MTKWPGIDKRVTGGLNEKGTKPQTSVSLWNQRKHSGYKLREKKRKRKKKKMTTKNNFEKAAEYKT